MILLLLVAGPSFASLLGGEGLLAEAAGSGSSRRAVHGALLVSHLSLTLCFAFVVPILLLKEFVLSRRSEPMNAHTWVMPRLFAQKAITVLLIASLFLWGSFYVLASPVLLAGTDRTALVLAAHLISGQLYFLLLGTLIAAVTRMVLTGSDLVARAEVLHRFAILPFLLLYPLFVVLPLSLLERGSGLPEALHTLGMRSMHLLQAPLAVATHVDQGSLLYASAWSSALLVGTYWSLKAVRRWSAVAPFELPVDLQILEARRPSRAASRLPVGPRGLRMVRLFAAKDVLLPYLRSPRRYLRLHVVTLGFGLSGLAGLASAYRGGLVGPAESTGALVFLALSGTTLTAIPHTVTALGREGARLSLLTPFLPPGRLYLLKAAPAALFAAVHGAVYAGLLLGAGAILQLPGIQAAPLLFVGAAAWAVPAALVGTSVGFLLPDLRARSVVLPGASPLGLWVSAGLVGGTQCILGAGTAAAMRSAIGFSELTVLSGVVVGLNVLAAWALGHWATARLTLLEP